MSIAISETKEKRNVIKRGKKSYFWIYRAPKQIDIQLLTRNIAEVLHIIAPCGYAAVRSIFENCNKTENAGNFQWVRKQLLRGTHR